MRRVKNSGIAGGTSCSSLWWMVFYNGMGLKLIKNIDTQWALSKQRNFLGTKQATAKLGGEAGTASPAEPEAQAFHLWGMVFASLLQTILGELLMPIDMIRTDKANIMIEKRPC